MCSRRVVTRRVRHCYRTWCARVVHAVPVHGERDGRGSAIPRSVFEDPAEAALVPTRGSVIGLLEAIQRPVGPRACARACPLHAKGPCFGVSAAAARARASGLSREYKCRILENKLIKRAYNTDRTVDGRVLSA